MPLGQYPVNPAVWGALDQNWWQKLLSGLGSQNGQDAISGLLNSLLGQPKINASPEQLAIMQNALDMMRNFNAFALSGMPNYNLAQGLVTQYLRQGNPMMDLNWRVMNGLPALQLLWS